MHDEFHKAAVVACRIILKPVVRLLLRYGLSCKEFCEIAKRTYVDVAMETSESERNISHIAVRTGLSRKAIKKMTALPTEYNNSEFIESFGVHHLHLLHKWFTDTKYLDKNGLPQKLHFSGGDSVTLLDLIRELAADVPHSTVLKELLASGVVDIDELGRYTPKQRAVLYQNNDPNGLIRASVFIATHAETVNRNFMSDEQNKLFERQAYSLRIPKARHSDFIRSASEYAKEYIEKLEILLDSFESANNDSAEYPLLGCGIYLFDCEFRDELSHPAFEGLGGPE